MNKTRYLILILLSLSQNSFAEYNSMQAMTDGINQMVNALTAPERREAERRQREREYQAYQQAYDLEMERLRIEQERLDFERQMEQQRLELEQQKMEIQQQQAQAHSTMKVWGESLSMFANERTAFVRIETYPVKKIIFEYGPSGCTVGDTAVGTGKIYVNGILIDIIVSCVGENISAFWAATDEDAAIISNEFIKKNIVILDVAPDYKLTFSAKGFTKIWNSL